MKTCKDCPAFKKAHVFQSTCSCGVTKTKISDACIMSGYSPDDTMIHETEEGWDMCVKGYLLLACHKQRTRARQLQRDRELTRDLYEACKLLLEHERNK